ncbi:ion channel protein [Demequina sp. SYSU T00039]|uniref:Ion channel protein n=1 Tax=Demequina lignilytica TaxID=3051663 RepID=A0AAW7M3Y0_9MICO|nr:MULTISPECIES: ion channel protein [unclassified Demequina]MDN4478601.1 ion channel protein [Demequina sp. SYSU T00039-1]MDN4488579.1 ion channel protein [Demequina sp. SYSU T00039]MDN4491605.1 ion channel protein [Demequina sp. SYSU T00068]
MDEHEDRGPGPAQLARAAVPALLIGAASALILFGADELALLLEHWWWETLPHLLGVEEDARWWIVVVLTITGALVGLVLWKAPGHGGHDTAAVELIAPPLPLRALPGVLAALVLGLAGGVSLGPEGPIIMIGAALAVLAYRWLAPAVPVTAVLVIAAAGMLGAMLGTPVAAALALTGALGGVKGGHLWDRLFAPLVAAGAGAAMYHLLGGVSWDMGLPAYEPAWVDLLTASVVAVVAALAGVGAAALFTPAWRLSRRLGHPMVYATVGGLLLGLLGVVGGHITLFKGAAETAEILADRDQYGVGALILIIVVKLVAVVVAGASGFRGGRIFPALFVGVVVGLLGHALIPGLPLAMAVAAGVMGMVLAISRDGWFAIFGGVLVAGDVATLAILCIAILPAWLVVTRAPHMLVRLPEQERAPVV